MSPDVEQALRAHASALRTLARDLVGEHHADDLVQETALQALQRPPRRPGALSGWLTQIVRHLANKHRRSQRRRLAREQRAARPEVVPPEDGAAEREQFRKLNDAVLALPEPYQTALLLRYLRDLPVVEVAERLQVPVATVKTRVQRGLELLRQRWRREREDWGAALCGALGLEAVGTGALIMGTGTKFALGSIAAALIAVAASWLVRVEPATTTNAALSAPDRLLTAAMPAPPAVAPEPAPATPRAELPSNPTAAALVSLVGRCVDEQGNPLARIAVALSAQRMDGAPMPAWRDQQQTTTADGRFALRFTRPDHAYVNLRFLPDRGDRIECTATWHDLPASDQDLGEVLIPVAIHITGRVIDTQGIAQAGVQISVEHEQRDSKNTFVTPSPAYSVATAADGSFTYRPLPAGRYWVALENRQLPDDSYAILTLSPAEPQKRLDLVVLSDADSPPIRGIVVADDGQPVPRANVTLGSASEPAGTDGRFVLRPGTRDSHKGPFRMRASADGYGDEQTGPIAAGADDVRIVLHRLAVPILRVRVRAADTGQAITTFAADRVTMNSAGRPGQKTNHPIRHWPDGVATVDQAFAGNHAVWVDPGNGPYAPSSFVPVHLEKGVVTEVTVELSRRAERLLRVQDPAGQPVRAAVELLDCWGQTLQLDTLAYPIAEWSYCEGPLRVVQLQRGTTDAQGELMLRGPAGRELALRLRGPGIALQTVTSVRLDSDQPLMVHAARGGAWTGSLVPATIGAALFAGSQPTSGEQPSRDAWGIQLWRAPDEKLNQLEERPFPYAADGTFRIDGIPAGTWQVAVFGLGFQYHAATITVQEGETLQQDLDVHAMRPCAVDIQIVLDGTPAAGASVNIFGRHALGVGGRPIVTQNLLRADAEGRVRFTTFPGEIGLDLHPAPRQSACTPPIRIPDADRFEQVLDLRVGTLNARVLRPDGEPAAGLQLALAGNVYRELTYLTDAQGRFSATGIPLGRMTVRARWRSLGTQDALNAYAQKNGWDAVQRAWLDIGTIEVTAGVGETELRLPAEWDR